MFLCVYVSPGASLYIYTYVSVWVFVCLSVFVCVWGGCVGVWGVSPPVVFLCVGREMEPEIAVYILFPSF